MEYLSLFVKSIFVDNMIFAYFLGMCSYLAVSKNVKTAAGLGVAVIFVLLVTLPINYLLNKYVLAPNALIEGMALGLACVSTDCPCGGPGELIQNGVNGFLVPVDDHKALAEKLRLLMGDSELRERMGKEALKVRETLAPEKVLAEWEEYLSGLISQN